MKMHAVIFRVIQWLLDINARVYGRGASHEVCRDMAARYGRRSA